ncbi:MAG: AI-2E family transporter [Pseudomonadota bacterium]|nr:AI-2E family transporter [Pseudomonadota bacterium]
MNAKETSSPEGPSPNSEREPDRVLLHMPVDVRNVALIVVAVIAGAFALQWAKAVFIPLLLGVMFSYALTPVVNRLEGWRVPRAAGAGLLLTAILLAIGWGVWSLSDEASALIGTLPQVAQKLRQTMQGQRQKPVATIEKVQQAATEIERVAENAGQPASAAPGDLAVSSAAASSSAVGTAPSSPAKRPSRQARVASRPLPETTTQTRQVTRVVVEKPGFDIKGLLWSGTLGAFAFLGQCAIVLFITFFLLASGDTFRRKMVRLAGPRLSQKRITIQALDEITDQIQRYLVVQLAVSVLVGVLTWLAFMAIGLDQAAIWGVVAGITNLIPYLGAVLIGGASALVGFIQFGALDMGLLVGVSSFGIHTVVGNLLTPWWMGRASRMSPFAVFVGVLVFGWLWGIWGLLLGVPILMVIKAICDRVDELNAIGELLGD